MKKEIWKPIVGFEKYYDISNYGKVSTYYLIGRPTKNGLLRQHTNRKGYKRVGLTKNKHRYSVLVHRLVLDAFVGPQPSVIHQANHKNGNKADNRAGNLEWVTPSENNRHAIKIGLWHPNLGEAHGRAKLKASDIPIIRACEGKETSGQVAKRYNVTSTCIYTIWKRINWKHIT